MMRKLSNDMNMENSKGLTYTYHKSNIPYTIKGIQEQISHKKGRNLLN